MNVFYLAGIFLTYQALSDICIGEYGVAIVFGAILLIGLILSAIPAGRSKEGEVCLLMGERDYLMAMAPRMIHLGIETQESIYAKMKVLDEQIHEAMRKL
jgi:hypothetical protein